MIFWFNVIWSPIFEYELLNKQEEQVPYVNKTVRTVDATASMYNIIYRIMLIYYSISNRNHNKVHICKYIYEHKLKNISTFTAD